MTNDLHEERVLADEPPSEPECFVHNSNVCGCAPTSAVPSAGGYSQEPPFPPGYGQAADDDPEPNSW
ncbi:hypothetical protein ABTX35_01530 [Streptomyces sp. NPDC096080]|uniref:hypothetical protein n=1 Tax=Streptomyces sp. NPDC096080 TaxID=3156693 RepID=UPI003330E475